MRISKLAEQKIYGSDALLKRVAQVKFLGKSVAFTNGIFDILHRGHIFSLSQAAAEADFFIVGLNSDASTKRLKGINRPINDEQSRALLLASLFIVDAVVIFDEDTPFDIINALKPDVLIKGGDYTTEQIAGASEVIANGGRVVINPIVRGFSTTDLIEKIRRSGG